MTEQDLEDLRVQLLDTATHYIQARRDAVLDDNTGDAAYYDRQYRQAMLGYHSLRDDTEVSV